MASKKRLRIVHSRPHQFRPAVQRSPKPSAVKWLSIAAVLGALSGIGSAAVTVEGRRAIAATVRPVAISLGIVRARVPQAGDHWYGCDAARAAGTAPIYAGEPGYREGLDGDSDGIACEPVRHGSHVRIPRTVRFSPH